MSWGKLPRRSPYLEGELMGRGSQFAKRFKHFVETGGVAKHKSCVAVNIRLNDIRDIDSANGNGTFRVSFFLDTAFWVPWWDAEHFGRQQTVGTFTKFEPELRFPGVDVEGGMLRWGLRTAEFGEGKARWHEAQLGQNATTAVAPRKEKGWKDVAEKLSLGEGGRRLLAKKKAAFVSVTDPGSHWPRMWRVLISDEEIAAMAAMPRAERKAQEPSNEEPMRVNARLKELLVKIDAQRARNLSHPDEGIGFVTYEIHCEASPAHPPSSRPSARPPARPPARPLTRRPPSSRPPGLRHPPK